MPEDREVIHEYVTHGGDRLGLSIAICNNVVQPAKNETTASRSSPSRLDLSSFAAFHFAVRLRVRLVMGELHMADVSAQVLVLLFTDFEPPPDSRRARVLSQQRSPR